MGINKPYIRPFLISTILIVLSIMAVVFSAVLIYTGIFFSEVQSGLEIYLSDTFVKISFSLIYVLLLFAALILIISVVLMWIRKKVGLFLFFSLSLILLFLLLFANPIDWFNIIILLILNLALILNLNYFSIKQEKKAEANSDENL